MLSPAFWSKKVPKAFSLGGRGGKLLPAWGHFPYPWSDIMLSLALSPVTVASGQRVYTRSARLVNVFANPNLRCYTRCNKNSGGFQNCVNISLQANS